MTCFAAWLFTGPRIPTTAWRVVAWSEARRLPFNVIVGVYAAVCLAGFFWAIRASGRLEPREDAVEPLALIAAPFVINALSTLGWLVEVPARMANPGLSPRFGVVLLKRKVSGISAGTAFFSLYVEDTRILLFMRVREFGTGRSMLAWDESA